MPTLFLKLSKERESGKFVDFNDLTPVWRHSCKKRLRMSTNDLYCQKLESLAYILPQVLYVTFNAIVKFLKVKRSESRNAGRKRILTWNSHSRSFWVIHFAINHRPTRGSISSYNIAGLISEVSEELATQIPKNCRRQQPHSHLRPRQEEPPHAPYIPRNSSHWSAFLSPTVWVYLHSNLCTGFKRRIFSILPFKVIQGQWFWYQSKACMRLPISLSLWLWSCLAPFLRYGDLLAKNCLFFVIPLSFGVLAPYVSFGFSRWS